MQAKAEIAGTVSTVGRLCIISKGMEAVMIILLLKLLGQLWILTAWKKGKWHCLVSCDEPRVCSQPSVVEAFGEGGCKRQGICPVDADVKLHQQWCSVDP